MAKGITPENRKAFTFDLEDWIIEKDEEFRKGNG